MNWGALTRSKWEKFLFDFVVPHKSAAARGVLWDTLQGDLASWQPAAVARTGVHSKVIRSQRCSRMMSEFDEAELGSSCSIENSSKEQSAPDSPEILTFQRYCSLQHLLPMALSCLLLALSQACVGSPAPLTLICPGFPNPLESFPLKNHIFLILSLCLLPEEWNWQRLAEIFELEVLKSHLEFCTGTRSDEISTTQGIVCAVHRGGGDLGSVSHGWGDDLSEMRE